MKLRAFFVLLAVGLVGGPCLCLFAAGVNNSVPAATVMAAQVNSVGHLVFTKSDGTQIDAGVLPTSAFVISVGTPTASTPGSDGASMMDANYLYTYLSGSWKKTPRYNL